MERRSIIDMKAHAGDTHVPQPTVVGIAVVLIVLCGACVPTEHPEGDMARLMGQYHAIGQFIGTVLVSKNGEVVYKQGFGEANREWGNPNGPDTKFRLGSVTKTFTATLVLNLVDDGLIDLEEPISRYLPEFHEDIGSQVTIHHLLTHTSGIALPAMSSDEYWDFFQRAHSTADLLKSLCSGDLSFEPGDRFQYSSAGYMVLGAIIERVTGHSYAEALETRILLPSGMAGTGVDDPEQILHHRATGYQTNYGLGTARYKYMPSSFSSGALYSTVEDIYHWERSLYRNKILSPESLSLMVKRHQELDDCFFGYGWFLGEWEVGGSTVPVAYHGGDVSGFGAFVLRSLNTNDLVVLLSNQEGLMYDEIARNLLGVLNGQPAKVPRAYVADLLRIAIYSAGLDEGRRTFEEIKDRGLENYNTDENELLEFGYDLLRIGMNAESILVFEIAADLHNDSVHSHDSLAEAYYTSGNLKAAAERYSTVLKLDPGNIRAAEMLEMMLAEEESQ